MNVSSVTIDRLANSRVKLTVEVPPETLEKGLAQSYKKNASRFVVPGFRKGKAPRAYVEKKYGAEVLYEDAVEAIFPECYKEAIEEHSLSPIDKPDFDIVTIRKGEPFVFTLEVTVRPEATLGQYKGVHAPYKVAVITDDDIDQNLKSFAESRARLVPVEGRPARIGDTVVIDYEGTIDGDPFAGSKEDGRPVELGTGQFADAFEKNLVGKYAGEEFDFEMEIPQDTVAAELRGKLAIFHVTLHTIKEKEVPEIDDEFASDYSEFETLAEFRDGIRNSLEEAAKADADMRFEEAVVNAVVSEAEVEIPEIMVKRQFDKEMYYLDRSAIIKGLEDANELIERSGMDRERFLMQMRQSILHSLRSAVVVGAVAKAEGIDPTDEDIDKELRRRKELEGSRRNELNGKGNAESATAADDEKRKDIKNSLISSMAVDFLVANARKEIIR